MKKILFLVFFSLLFAPVLQAQVLEKAGPVLIGSSKPSFSPPISSKVLPPPDGEFKIVNPKVRSANRVVPGKGYPKTIDAAWQKKMGQVAAKAPLFTFDAASSGSTPTDPTGAVGPNHYVNAWNSAFAIYDKSGNPVSPPAALEALGGEFIGEDLGDPIVQYDSFADRYIIMQFAGCSPCEERVDETNALLVAISQGPDPVNDGWYTYRFKTGTFPDYPKLFVWSDGYYVTTNQDPTDPDFKEVVYVLERDAMLAGEDARHVGLPLPGAKTNGFYSPAAFNAVGDALPPRGDVPILYFQDDAWFGVNQDFLKIWLVNVDWSDLASSSIEESQEIGTSEGITPFHSTFDGGSFSNLSQPNGAPDVDALQGAVMYPTSFRQFETHNSVVFNFVVDIDPSVVEHAGIRWYELRQPASGGPWSVYQEGTYAPDGSDRWCGSIGIDKNGNIALAYTVLNDNENDPVYPSLRYTGRYAGDPLGVMTLQEQSIVEGEFPDRSSRYGDYSHLSIDPVDDETFWFIGEYFGRAARLNKVGVFKIAPEFVKDVGVVDIVSPISETLGAQEEVTIIIRNFGKESQSNFTVSYSIDDGPAVTETFTGTIASTEQAEYTFTTPANLSEVGRTYTFTASTNLEGDEEPENDSYSEEIENLPPKDVGVTVINGPESGTNLGQEEITVTVENFGGEPQTNFPVAYSIDGGSLVTEFFEETLEVKEEASFVFNQKFDFSEPRVYEIFATTQLANDANPDNDSAERIMANMDCIPDGSSCAFGDGIFDFYLEDIVNENIYCSTGYYDFLGISTRLDRSKQTFQVGVSSHSQNQFSLWIDFNDNAVFESEEQLISSAVIKATDQVQYFEFTLPDDAPLGQHIMRARAGDTAFDGDLNDPCSVMDYGMTQDYSVVIVDRIAPSEIEKGEFIITTTGDDIFEALFTTDYQGPVWIDVYDMLGQLLVENKIDKKMGQYSYTLDMSYVATGVYLVRIGTRKEGKVQRIIVH